MRMLVWIMLSFVALAPARAADTVATGPVPAWVRPVAVPAPAGPASGDVSYLLSDTQLSFEPGKLHSYSETVLRIETPDGLSAGNISLSWRPGLQAITVHRLTIRRDDRVIDVLASGQGFTVLRREANLESAMLDGELTANIQPEGLQVGDIVTVASTITSSDPTYAGHVEHRFDAAYGVALRRQHFSAQWPAALPLRLRQTSGLPIVEPRRQGDLLTAELTVDGLEPAVLPSSAPNRYRRPRLIELSDFRSWSQLAGLFMPLYDRAATLASDSPLQAEIAHIRSSAADPKARAEAALALVQDRVRYVALLMGDGNFVPADATQTWNRRFGDCKAKSALLLAILRGLGIPADPVLVNVDDGDGLDARLPMIGLFNHVIVRTTIDGRSYWLDGTRTGDVRLDQIATPDFGWSLPLVADAVPVRLVPEAPALPLNETRLRIDASKGIALPAPIDIDLILRGDGAYELQASSTAMTPAERERRLRDSWKKNYDYVEVQAVDTAYDPDRREYRLHVKGQARLDWQDGVYWLPDGGLGDSRTDFERDEKEDQTAPFLVTYPYFRQSTLTMLLPPGIVPDEADANVIAGGVHYRRKTSFADNVFTMETSSRSLAPEFPAREGPSAQKAIRALAETHVALRVGNDYRRTPAETEAKLAKKADTAEELVEQGIILLDRSDNETALARFDQAVAMEPRNADALAGRGMARTWLSDLAGAERDFAATEAIQPDHWTLALGRGLLAQLSGRNEEALRYYDHVIEQSPDDVETLGRRAQVNQALRRYPAALRDVERALEAVPDWISLYGLKADLLRLEGSPERAVATVDKMLAAYPDDRDALAEAGRIYELSGKREQALRAYGRALDIKKTSHILTMRSNVRPWNDVEGRSSDLAEALRIDPQDVGAMYYKALLQGRSGDLAGMIATLSAALRIEPGDVTLMTLRAQAKWLSGRKAEARKEFAAARAAATDETDLTGLCWYRAIADIDLPDALADCDAALSKAPTDQNALESRGFALVKLGRYDEAILTYDRALAADSTLTEALLGRAVAWKHKGDQEKADADMAAVMALDRDVVTQFRSYGMVF